MRRGGVERPAAGSGRRRPFRSRCVREGLPVTSPFARACMGDGRSASCTPNARACVVQLQCYVPAAASEASCMAK
jgi:hypothetical protein